jgi:Spy/CpxP family protein refolding chaperone
MKKTLIMLAVCGTLATGTLAACASGHHFDPEKRIEHMKKALNLTDAQATQIKTIYTQNEATFKADHEAVKAAKEDSDAQKAAKAKMKADMEAVQAQVTPILTADQQAKWKEMKAKHEAEHKDKD